MSNQHNAAAESADQKRGLTVFLILAILTVAEYLIAVGLDNIVLLVVLLSAAALAKCWAIAVYFMHISRLWRGEEAH
ncbi:MAG: cytochrome C oxidase subunit IV family protein [Dehalococcoidia bacterium]